ncbi:hypothetical protein MTO96_020657 [Rhipicephalus appendiculatus]
MRRSLQSAGTAHDACGGPGRGGQEVTVAKPRSALFTVCDFFIEHFLFALQSFDVASSKVLTASDFGAATSFTTTCATGPAP